MKPNHQPHMPRQRIDAFAAAICPCVRRLIWLALTYPLAGRKRAMRRQVRRFEYLVECMIVLRAALLVRTPPKRRRHRYTPAGFRRTHTNPRRFMRLARIRLHSRSLLARLYRLIVVLRAPQAHSARLARIMRRGVCASRLVATAPPARAFFTRAAPALTALADSS